MFLILGHSFTVYPWMQYGNLTNYLKLFPDANRMTIVRVIRSGIVECIFLILIGQAYQIAEGLKVLHGHTTPIAHGDLRPVSLPSRLLCKSPDSLFRQISI